MLDQNQLQNDMDFGMILLAQAREMAKSVLSHDIAISGLMGSLVMSMLFAVLLLIYKPVEIDPARLEPVSHMQYAEIKLPPAELARRIPNIKFSACIFSEHVVRHYVRPAPVSLPSCGANDFHVEIAENLIDITVSGIATIDKIDHPFTVVLQHNPSSVEEDGLLVATIDVKDISNRCQRYPCNAKAVSSVTESGER